MILCVLKSTLSDILKATLFFAYCLHGILIFLLLLLLLNPVSSKLKSIS